MSEFDRDREVTPEELADSLAILANAGLHVSKWVGGVMIGSEAVVAAIDLKNGSNISENLRTISTLTVASGISMLTFNYIKIGQQDKAERLRDGKA